MKKSLNKGMVYLIGAGPGDPGLITVKGLARLKMADVILYDRLIPGALLGEAKKGAGLKYIGKEKGDKADQERINRLILKFARQGKRVARLKGGDPFIFGRGHEEARFLRDNGIDCEVVPGVSSCYAVPEARGIPLTRRGISSSFMVLTGHESPSKQSGGIDWRQAAKFKGTIVIMMGLSNLKEITGRLITGGKNPFTPCAVISHGTTGKEKSAFGVLKDIAAKARAFGAPAVCVIGETVRARESILRPASPVLPLLKKRYITTASENLNEEISEGLERLGATVARLPMIAIRPNKDTSQLDKIISGIRNFDWLIFTSRHGAHYFLKRYFLLKKDPAALSGKVACVGTGTAAEFLRHGINSGFIPDKFTTRELGRALALRGLSGKKVALLRTRVERDFLKGRLLKAGAEVADCAVYDVRAAGDGPALVEAVENKPDGIFFLSPKSADTFFRLLPEKFKSRLKSASSFYSIGPVTANALKAHGVNTVRTPKEQTVQGLVDLCSG